MIIDNDIIYMICFQVLALSCVIKIGCIYLNAFEARLAEPMQISNISFLVPAKISNSHLNARGRQEVNVVLSYLKTLRSSSEMAIAYCSDGSVTINLLQHLSRLLISWVLMYLNPALFLLEMHLEHFSGSPDLRLVLGMAVSGLGAIF